jgi:glycosyltransferase involved in cell wall biosynthesis
MIVPNGVEESAWIEPTNRDALATACKLTACQRPIVLFLSRLHPKKGITDLLLPAFASMKVNATLAIAGGEDDRAPGYENEIRRTISRYRLHDRVVLLGPVNGNQRWALFDSADLFVLPSHSENFGVVVAEAMARGCPVVVADSVQSWMHVVAAGAGEVVPGDAANVATALDRVLSDTALRKRYGEAGRVYAERHFRWNQIAQQVQEMYWESLYVPRVSNQDKGMASKDVEPRMRAMTKL